MSNINQPVRWTKSLIQFSMFLVGMTFFTTPANAQIPPAEFPVITGTGLTGMGVFNCPVMPDFNITVSGDVDANGDTAIPGQVQTIDNGGAGFEAIFGQVDAADNIEVEVAGAFVAAGTPITNTVITTLDFIGMPTPAGEFSFIIADVEQDQVQICALDANGQAVPVQVIAGWHQASFDADNSDPNTIPPTWDTATGTLVGQEGNGVPQTIYQPALPDNEAGSAWFTVDIPITQLTFKSQALGVAPDDPSQHFIFASTCAVYDIALVKELTSSPTDIAPGDNVDFNITVCNQGNVDSGPIEVTDIIPAGMTLSTSDANGWTGPLLGPVTNTTGNITPGNCEIIPIQLTIEPTFTGTTITNNAVISADNGDDVDSDPNINVMLDDLADDDSFAETDGGDDEDPEQITVVQTFDLALIKEVVTPGPYMPGDDVTYTITVCNQGTLAGTNIQVTDFIPTGMTLSPIDGNGWAGPLTGPVSNVIASLPVTTCQTLDIVLRIDPTFSGTMLSNNAVISQDNGDDVDSDPAVFAMVDDFADNDDFTETDGGDDEDPELIEVEQSYDLALIKEESSMGPYAPGDDVTFTITITNQGSLDAGAITITDFIPAGMMLSAADGNGWAGPQVGPVTNALTGPIAGGTTTVDIVLTIDPTFMGESLVNFAEISSDSGDDVDSAPDATNGNDAGGAPNSPSDDVDAGDGTGTPGDMVAATDEDDHDPEMIMIGQMYDLALIKEETSVGPYQPGDDVTYTITIENQGTIDAGTITITDFIPSFMTLSAVDANGWIGNPQGPVTNTLTGPAVGSSTTLDIVLTIDPSFGGGQLINIAEISADSGDDVDSTADGVNGNDGGGGLNTPADDELNGDGTGPVGGGVAGTDEDDQDPEDITVQIFDLALVKSLDASTPGPFMPGEAVTFELEVFNQGTLDAFSVGLSDIIPSGLTLADSDWTASGSSATLITPIAFIPVGGSATTTITFVVDANFAGTSITNDAEISAADDDTNSGNTPPTDVDSTPGDNATPVDTANNDDTADTAGGDDQDPETIVIEQPDPIFDLALTKTLNAATPGPFMEGDVVTYDIEVINQGATNAFNVGVIDYTPSGLTLADGNWTVSGATAALNSPIPFIAPGTSETVTITFVIDAGTAGSTLVNDAEISAADDDTDPNNAPPMDVDSAPGDNGTPIDTANDDDTADTMGGDDQDPEEITIGDVDPIFDLALTKTLNAATPGPFMEGDVVTYDIEVINQGATNAFNVGVIDYIPTGLTLADANWTASGATAALNSPIPFIAPGTSETVTITFIIDAGTAGSTLVNDAEISAADDDTDPNNAPPMDVDSAPGDNGTPVDTANDDDTADTMGGDDQDPAEITVGDVDGLFDLAIAKTLNANTPGPFMAGDVVTFDVTVTNQGTVDAFTVGLIDYIPAGLVLADADWSMVGANAVLNAPIPFIAAGTSVTETITFVIDASFTGTVITNVVEINEADDDTDPNNMPPTDIDSSPGDGSPVSEDDTDDEPITLIPSVFDLALVKTLNAGTTGPFAPGDVVTFDIEVFNQGTADAFSIDVVDYIPAGLILNDVNWTVSGTNATLVNPIPFIAAGSSMMLTITFQIDPAFMGTSIVNNAEVASADDDTDPTNTPPTDADSAPGDNSQPDDFPDNDDPNETDGGDDEDPEEIIIGQVYDLALSKDIVTPGPYTAGQDVTFSITVCNEGTLDAANITITDNLPLGLTLSTADNNGWVGPLTGPLTNMIASLPVGTCSTIEIVTTIDPAFMGTSLENFAQITGDDGDDIDSDPNAVEGTDDEDPEIIPIGQVYDLALIKEEVSAGPYMPGDNATFAIMVCNQGTLDASNIEITDNIPSGLLLSADDTNGWSGPASGPVTTIIPSILPGSCQTVNIILTVDPAFTGTSITNNAEISADDGDDIDSTPGDNSQPDDFADDDDLDETDGGDDEDPETIVVNSNVFDLALIKTVTTPGPFTPGQDVTFTITVFNQGTLDAVDIEVTDVVPAGLSLSANDNNGWVTAGASSYTNVIAGTIPPGGSASIDIVLTIDADFSGSSLVNNAEISGDNGDDIDSTPGDNSQPNDFPDDNTTNETDGGDDQDPARIEIGDCPALVCNDNLQISIGLECFIALTADLLLEAPSDFIDYEIRVFDEDGIFIGDTITGDHTGQILSYRVISPCDGNSCWGEINFEANILPQIFSDCPYIPGEMAMKQGTFSSSSNTTLIEICKTDDCQQSLIIESLTNLQYSPGADIWELSGVDWEVFSSAGISVLSGELGPEGDSDVEDISSLPNGCYTVQLTGIIPDAMGDFKFSVSVPSCEVGEACQVWCGGGLPDGFITLQEAEDLVNNGCAAQIIGDIIVDESVSGDICNPDGSIRVVTYTAKIEMHGVISTVVLASQAFAEEKLDITPGVGNTQILFPRSLEVDCDTDIEIDTSLVFGSPAYIEALTGSGAAAFPSFFDKHATPVPDTIFGETTEHVVRVLDTIDVMTQQLITTEDGNTSLEWVLIRVVDKITVDSIVPDTIIPGTFSQPLVPIKDRICNLLVTYDDLTFSACAGGEKIVREWTVIDWCESNTSLTGFQNIEISDQTPPVVGTPDAVIVSTDPWTCSAKVQLPELDIEDNCSTNFNTVWTTSEGRIVEDYALDLWPSGDTIHITANVIDECGNTSPVIMPVFVTDNVPPAMVCTSTLQVALTYDANANSLNGGVARVDVSSFDGGSNDSGCGDVKLQVVRLDDWSDPLFDCAGNVVGFKPNSCQAQTSSVDLGAPEFKNDCTFDGSNLGEITMPGDFVKFCCTDAGQIVQVVLIGTDESGNTSHCIVDVLVVDGTNPSIVCEDVVIDCAGDLELVEGPKMIGGACEGERQFEILSEENTSGSACGAGTMIREYYIDRDGSGGVSSGDPYCQQIITIKDGAGSLNPYTIKWPRHHDGTVLEGINLECNSEGEVELFEDVSVAMGDVVTCVPDEDTGEIPTWCDTDCGLVGITTDIDSVFVSDACLKIIKRWTVVDWCTYDPNGSGVDDDNDSGRDQFVAVEDWAQGECADCDTGDGPVHGSPVYFRYTQFDADGYYTFDQIIKVVDDSAPEIDAPTDYVVNTSGGATTKDDVAECTGSDVISASAQDFCGGNLSGSSKLTWVIAVMRGDETLATKTAVGASATMNSQEGSPGDTHVIRWRVTDGCGNTASATTTVTFGDETSPVPFCVAGLTTAYMQDSGCVDVWSTEFDFGSFDNCTDASDLAFSIVESGTAPIAPGQPGFDEQSSIRLCCSDLSNFVELDIWVWDVSGNGDFCTVGIVIEDNGNVCPEEGSDEGMDEGMDEGEETPNAGATAMISGQITTEQGDLVDQTTMTISSILAEYPQTTINSDDGIYAFANNPLDFDYSITAERDGDDANGVSTLDMVLITRHILGLSPLDSPYKIIAADVNNNQSVSTVDLVGLKSLILGLTNDLANNTSWRFVESELQFFDDQNPWPFVEQQMVFDLAENMMNEDFIAVKIGDVNGDAQPNALTSAETRTSGMLSLNVDEARLDRGEEVKIDITSDNFNSYYGFQFTLAHQGLEFKAIEAGRLDVDANSLGIFDDQLTMTWFSGNPVDADETLFSLVFTATQSVALSDALALNSSITKTEAYRGSGFDSYDIELTFGDEGLASDQFELFQNNPNPFEESTKIGFNVPTAGIVNLIVYDLTGKVLKQVEGNYAKGYNEISVHKTELNTTGVFYYRLDSGSFSATRKMILMD